MTFRVVAPASTANLGPGFDAAAAALDLWNEVVVEEGPFAVEIEGEGAGELPRDETHLALRAFALLAPVERHRFHFTNRIPLERGLGSSAAAIGLGLVAAAGAGADRAKLLALGATLEGHADNLAAVLYGGVCLTWQWNGTPHARRIASDMPVAPVLVVPNARTSTAQSRSALPLTVAHGDAAASAGAAALLGAAIASGDAELLGEAFNDRLHEPYRTTPLLTLARPEGTVGVTLSGSGPSVVVWAENRNAHDVAEQLRANHPDTTVLPLRVAEEGARLEHL